MVKGIEVNKDFEKEVIKMEMQVNFENRPRLVEPDCLICYLELYLEDKNLISYGILLGMITLFHSIDAISYKEFKRLNSVLKLL